MRNRIRALTTFRKTCLALGALLVLALVATAGENYNTGGRWVSTGSVTIPDGNGQNDEQVTTLTLGSSGTTTLNLGTSGTLTTLNIPTGVTFTVVDGVITGANDESISIGGTDATFTFTTDGTETAIFTGADAAGASNTTYSTSTTGVVTLAPAGAGAVVVGSATTATLDIDTNGAMTIGTTVTDTLDLDTAGALSLGTSGTDSVTIAATGSFDIGNNVATDVTIDTDGVGDAELVLPAQSVSAGEITKAGRSSFVICGEATTVNNNTVYYGPDVTLLGTSGFGGATCDINAAGNTTEATADAPIYTSQAVEVMAMTCRNEGDANDGITFALRTAEGATVPSVTCEIADGERDCVADVQSTTDIAAAATVAVAVSGSADIADNNGFVCEIEVAF